MKQQSIFDLSSLNNSSLTEWHVYVDGAARNNPGPAGAGVYVVVHNKVYQKIGHYLGKKTNNQAEYLALILALWYLKSAYRPTDRMKIFSDSQLLVRQVLGMYKVRDEKLQSLKSLVNQLLSGVSYTINHIVREENVMADALANQGIDEQCMPPPDYVRMLRDHDVAC